MNYRNPQLRALLAGEYVLGTLHGRARRRFERLRVEMPELDQDVRHVEQQLAELNTLPAPVTPPARVWRAIETHLDRGRAALVKPASLGWWRALGLASSAVAVALAWLVAHPLIAPPAPSSPSYVAVVRDQAAAPLWVVQIDPARDTISLKSLHTAQVEAGKDLELWLLPAGDTPPVSLGLLPKSGERAAALRTTASLGNAKGLAVSLEPAGGSPTGAPTGPVLYQADLIPLG